MQIDRRGDCRICWVCRKQAKFQWAHARDLKPEPEELPKIEAKIKDGLPEEKEPTAAANDVKKDDKGG